ncbi:adenosylmethionine decarboxylase [Chitinibacter bivalviorum]|uniref:S-adenosylmethionine decarboxylase proenzyme n=1 Tax=Chitinibacter bivalviorum TaxID=2739434 RepID=A0A7H9BJF7_9NEIS|nr:adenosylmethionine decarboxylase [Chitinibacter bivalviorum]QLG88141.1 adenosylmethionine decarboxylase [Chitinibacter bivalviorum]
MNIEAAASLAPTPVMPLGRHLIADFQGCPAAVLSDPAKIEQVMLAAAKAGQATVLQQHFHHFGVGQGVTGMLLLMESHISIHTWPEHGYAAIDLFMCGAANADAALAVLQAALQPEQVTRQVVLRGSVDFDGYLSKS